ncbi:MAG: condensation domain-containing protein, partial [Myxococcaceae bacterium]
VELTHRNIVHAFASFDELYATHPGDRWAASASIAFDAHLEELLFSLTRGASIVLRSLGPQGLARDVRAFAISHVVTTPSSLAVAAEEEEARDAFRALAVVISGGEALPERLVEQLDLTRTRLVNSYGPTEATINATAQVTVPNQPVRLGRPLDRCTCYVLDEAGAPVPVGVPGELYVGGAGLGRGYRGRPDLTAERFLPDPFSDSPGARMYRTGDRVRWNDDGSLSFLGRTDFQVKVRGIRIELEEVESALLRIPDVRQAAVIARKAVGQTRLDAFLVVDGLSATAVRERLSAFVPEAMVPARFTLVEALPLTSSGKVDRKALTAIPVSEPEPDAAFEPPRSEHEVLIAQLFAQLLGLEHVGRDDDFFALGGHSLSAVQLVSRIRRIFGVELPLATIFAHSTVAELARCIQAAAPNIDGDRGPVRRPAGAPLLLSHAQERMWFLHQLHPDSAAYNVPDALELEGPVSADALESALRLLVERHSALRLIVETRDGKPAPALLEVPERVLSVEDLGAQEQPLAALEQRLFSEANRAFDLTRGPLFRFTLFRTGPERHVLLLLFHHIVVDGSSLEIFVRELGEAYEAFSQHRASQLRHRALDYADVAAWLRSDQVEARDAAQLEYWKQQLENVPAVLELPTDFPRPAALSNRGDVTRGIPLPKEVASSLQSFCRKEHVTPFMVTWAAFTALLHRCSGQEDFCVGVPVAGRTHPSTEDVVGLFVNTLPLRTRFSPSLSFVELVRQVRETTLDAFTHQDVPFERLVDALQIPRSVGHSPLVQVMFVWDRDRSSGQFGDLRHSPRALHSGDSKFDLNFAAVEKQDGLELSLEFNAELYELSTTERLVAQFIALLEQALQSPATPVSQLSLLDEAERTRVVEDFNDTDRPFEVDATLPSLFGAQVARTPDAVAVVAPDATLTFR